MRRYKLEYIVNGRKGRDKFFGSRKAAESYMNRVLLRKNLDVYDIIMRNNDHTQEFYCNDYSRFIIERVQA